MGVIAKGHVDNENSPPLEDVIAERKAAYEVDPSERNLMRLRAAEDQLAARRTVADLEARAAGSDDGG